MRCNRFALNVSRPLMRFIRVEVMWQAPANGCVVGVDGEAAAAYTFERFYEAEYRGVLAVCIALVGHGGTAEDVAQEAFLRMYVRWKNTPTLSRPDAYVRRVAANLATSWHRRLAAEARAMLRLSGRPEAAPPTADEGWFWAAVRRLPPKQAQAVALRYADDLAVADIALVLGCAEGTVSAHLHAARKTLSKQAGDAR